VPDETGSGSSDWGFPPVELPPPYLPPPYVPPPSVEPVAEQQLEARLADPPSAAVLPVPRRTPTGSSGPVSPMRALAGASVAVAGVLLGIGALLWATDAPKGTPALQQPQAQTARASTALSPMATPSPDRVMVTPAPLLSTPPAVASQAAPAPKLPLTVLNNSTRSKLADRVAERYRAAGWPVKVTGNFRGRIVATTAYYAPGQLASAQALQKAFPAIERVLPRFEGLPGSGLTVVLTRSYPG
jgi:LytR cell envelope-related transcriptional attenuator